MKLTVDDHLEYIKENLLEGSSYREIAEALGCSHDTVAIFTKVHLPELRRTASQASRRAPIERPEEPTEAELLRAELKEARAASRKHRSVDVQAELLLNEVRALVPPTEPTFEPPEQAEGDGSPHVHALLLSDLHVGEIVDPEAVNGLNEFNWGILVKRMARIQKALRSFQNARPYPIDELHLWWLGDMCGGRNHEELAETNEFPVTDQCLRTGLLLGEFVEPLVEDYPKIIIKGVSGNHPRVGAKPSNKQVFDSFDWLSYHIAGNYLAKYETIDCEFPRSGYLVDEIAGNNVLLFHGDGIRSSMPGVPWGGVMRRFNELKKSYAAQGVLLDHAALGHFHQAAVVSGIFMNGSVKGLDEYSLKQFGAGEKPTQLLLTFNRAKKRLTDVSYITP